jgi:hypothetical protein
MLAIGDVFLCDWASKCLHGARFVGNAFRNLTLRRQRKAREGTENSALLAAEVPVVREEHVRRGYPMLDLLFDHALVLVMGTDPDPGKIRTVLYC